MSTPHTTFWLTLSNIWQLGIKELRSLWRDRLLLLFVIWAFSGAIYTAAKGAPDRLLQTGRAVLQHWPWHHGR